MLGYQVGVRQVFFLCLLMVLSGGFAQEVNLTSQEGVFVDYARFRYDAQSVYLEVCYEVNPVNLTGGAEGGMVHLEFQLLQKKDQSLVARQAVNVGFGQQGSGTQTARLGLLKSVIPAGEYILRVNKKQPNGSVKVVGEYAVSAKSFSSSRITLSDLLLCSNIIPGSNRKHSPFYKNRMEVVPNPARLFNVTQNPRLYYYIELYNTQKAQPAKPLDIQVVLFDQEGQIRAGKHYRRPTKYESLVERGAFNLSKLESGLYTLSFIVTDSSENYSVYRRENFLVNNPNVKLISEDNDELAFSRSEFFNMPEDVVEDLFEKAGYLASREEIEVFKSLNTVESKRKYLFDFWRKKEKGRPGFRQEYYARVNYCDQQFGASGVPGWKTDRGRVYILYGPPDNIERHPVEPGTNPYEVWFYEQLEGGSEFDFIDFTGFGHYQLVNSTVRNEIHDPNWKNLLSKK